MKFQSITPEQAGIRSETIVSFLREIGKFDFNMHDFLFLKDDAVFFEAYYAPFTRDFLHRQYSQTKSLVSLAIGFLLDEGKLKLSDHVADFFPDKIHRELKAEMKNLTIRELLMMETCVDAPWWLSSPDDDRVSNYLNADPHRVSSLFWRYDSDGSEILSALAERLSGKTLLDYVKEKAFDEMEAFQNARMLQCPHGYSWGDSGLLATPRDMAAFAYLVMNGGNYHGHQLVSRSYLKDACSRQVDNSVEQTRTHYSEGYGYLIWQFGNGNYGFVGMGGQLTFICPEKKLIFICNADNQHFPFSRELLLSAFTRFSESAADGPLPENPAAHEELLKVSADLKIPSLPASFSSSSVLKTSGNRYALDENPMGIRWFELRLEKDSGSFIYENRTGRKEISFGIGKNVFASFPEEGYSDEIGNVKTKGHFYRSASSGAWLDSRKFRIRTNIIDKYFGQLDIFIAFQGKNVYLSMIRIAENFLNEYSGEALGTLVSD